MIPTPVSRLLAKAYYEYCYDRRVPLGGALGRYVRAWEQRHRRRDAPLPGSTWDAQYAAGEWSFLRDAAERGRYDIVAGYLDALRAGGTILDIGCGEGLLLHRLRKPERIRYIGIDVSLVALRKAKADNPGRAAFVCANAEDLFTAVRPDAVVFNESLYYFERPVDTALRYMAALQDGGIAIVSMYLGSHRSRAILRALQRRRRPVDESRISHGADAWSVSVYDRPAGV
jgi:SAM-dependent methyltransferase